MIVFFVVSFTAIFPVCFAEPLEMHDFPCAQEADRVADFLVMDEAKDIVIGGAGFLLCCHILCQIRNCIPLRLEDAGIKGSAARGLGPKGQRMVHVIFIESRFFDFIHRKVFRQLVNDGRNHLHMG